MKFCKKYEEYMQGQIQKKKNKLPRVGFKRLKKILKRCRRDLPTGRNVLIGHSDDSISNLPVNGSSSCPHRCPVCDGTFFPSLLKEMSAVVDWFNLNAQRLLELHLASGFRKCFVLFKEKNHVSLVQEGRELVKYAIINAIAMRKILKKYDKIHYSNQGQAFKSQANSMHIEILQSPWLCELMAFHINLMEMKHHNKQKAPAFFDGCSLIFKDGKPSLLCELFDPVKLEIDLTCSICLDTVFDPVSLTCGHIFCYMCACKAGSVTIIDGLKAAHSKEKCPLCRAGGVYEGGVHLEELNILLRRSCPEYWEERLQTERVERVKQAKEHWESQCRAFTGI